MEIKQITNAPLSTNTRTFGAYKLAQEWKPFTTEIQNLAAKKCVSNMDGDFYRQLVQDLQKLNEGKVNIVEILHKAASRIVDRENLSNKAVTEYDKFVDNITKSIDDPSNVDVIVSKPYWGKARLENVEGEMYPANVTDSFIDLTIPNTDFKCSLKLGTERRFFDVTGTPNDDFHFARKKWNNFDDDNNITPFAQMLADFNEALIKGFEDLYESLTKKNTGKGSGKIAPNMNNTSSNSNFIYFY